MLLSIFLCSLKVYEDHLLIHYYEYYCIKNLWCWVCTGDGIFLLLCRYFCISYFNVEAWLAGLIYELIFLLPVLPGSKRLVVVRLLLLPPTGLHRNLLYTHVLRDAQSQERHADRTQRPHETGIHGEKTRTIEFKLARSIAGFF